MSVITAVFFDIDGTLVETHGAGREAFSNALATVFREKDDLRYVHFAGGTDLDIFREVMNGKDIKPTKKQENDFFRELPLALSKSIAQHVVTMNPGVQTLLERLTSRTDVLVGLLTGNTEECARIKLRPCNIHGHFVLGAFGREHVRRSELARLVVRRAEKHLGPGQQLGPCFIIGDTPSDVAAAKAIKATSIAVATGIYDEKALEAIGATHVVSHLSDTDHIMTLLQLSPTTDEG